MHEEGSFQAVTLWRIKITKVLNINMDGMMLELAALADQSNSQKES